MNELLESRNVGRTMNVFDPSRSANSKLRQHDLAIILTTFVLMSLFCLCSEKVLIGGGFGWDGKTYGEMARNFYGETIEKPIDAYRVQRLLPSLIVHIGLRALGVELSNINIIHGFEVMNVLSLTFLAWCWCRISNVFKIGPAGRWLGFSGFFLSYGILKRGAFYAVVTDTPALAISGAMLLCYLESRRVQLLLLSTIGAFTWPTLLMQGFLLAAFPRYGDDEVSRPTPLPWKWNLIVAALAAYYTAFALASVIQITPSVVWCGVPLMRSVIALSALISTAFVFLVLRRLVVRDWLADARQCLDRSSVLNWVLVLAWAAGVKYVQSHWASRPSLLAPQTFFLFTGVWSIAKPGIFLVAHAIYFGPIFVLSGLLWKPICRELKHFGPGLTLNLLLGTVLALDSESRHLLTFAPLLIAITVRVTERLNWNRIQYASLIILSLISSKCWMTFNAGTMTGNAFKWPDQRYMMSNGPYMSDEMYYVQGGLVLLATFAIYAICCRRQLRTSADVGAKQSSRIAA